MMINTEDPVFLALLEVLKQVIGCPNCEGCKKVAKLALSVLKPDNYEYEEPT